MLLVGKKIGIVGTISETVSNELVIDDVGLGINTIEVWGWIIFGEVVIGELIVIDDPTDDISIDPSGLRSNLLLFLPAILFTPADIILQIH